MPKQNKNSPKKNRAQQMMAEGFAAMREAMSRQDAELREIRSSFRILKDQVDGFERASGVDPRKLWSNPRIGPVVRELARSNVESEIARVEANADHYESLAASLRSAADGLRTLK